MLKIYRFLAVIMLISGAIMFSALLQTFDALPPRLVQSLINSLDHRRLREPTQSQIYDMFNQSKLCRQNADCSYSVTRQTHCQIEVANRYYLEIPEDQEFVFNPIDCPTLPERDFDYLTCSKNICTKHNLPFKDFFTRPNPSPQP